MGGELLLGSYAVHRGFQAAALVGSLYRQFTLERGLVIAALLFVMGFCIDAKILADWVRSGFGTLDAVRPAFLALLLMVVGAQVAFSAVFFSMLVIPIAEE